MCYKFISKKKPKQSKQTNKYLTLCDSTSMFMVTVFSATITFGYAIVSIIGDRTGGRAIDTDVTVHTS